MEREQVEQQEQGAPLAGGYGDEAVSMADGAEPAERDEAADGSAGRPLPGEEAVIEPDEDAAGR